MPTKLQREWVQALGTGAPSQSPTTPEQLPEDGKRPADQLPEDGKPPADQPAAAPSAVRLGGSVGAGGRNAKADVRAVQLTLNERIKAGLKDDGVCGPKTIAAIKAFQKQLKLKTADGRVDPGGPTEQALNGGTPVSPSPTDETGAGPKGAPAKGGGAGKPPAVDAKPAPKDEKKGSGKGGASGAPEPDFSRLARRIRAATEGLGTDEAEINAVLAELKGSREHRIQLGKVYQQMFGENLEALLRAELNDKELKKANDAANRSGEPDFAALARQIQKAAEGLGTDEAAIFAALAQVKGNPKHMAKLRAVFQSMFGQNLDAVLRDELSGVDLKKAKASLDPKVEVIPDKVSEEDEGEPGFRRRHLET